LDILDRKYKTMDAHEDLGISELNDAYTSGDTCPVDVVQRALVRIEKHEPKLGAFEVVLADQALEAAEAATQAIHNNHRIGPFHGVPFVLKDLVHVEGTVTTGGANPYANRVSTETATIANRLIAGGGILLGKTKTVEVAYGPWGTNTQRGTPWNPWDTINHRAPGGSSSGTGASVAARIAPCGLGTDTGGSVRIPSSFCGLVGLKVTEGQLPLKGIQPLSHTLDTPGPMCRNAVDAAIMYQTMAGCEPHKIDADLSTGNGIFREMARGVKGLVIGVIPETERSIVDANILDLYDDAVARLKKMGAFIKPLTFPRSLDDMRFGVATIIGVEGYYYHKHLYENPQNAMDEDVKARIMAGKNETSNNYVHALRSRLIDRAAFVDAMDGMAALLTPTVPIQAPIVSQIDQPRVPSQFTRMVNHLGFCGLSTPMGMTEVGLPGGLQIIGRSNEETMTLRIGAAFANDFGDIGPPPDWD
jgi:aspartyl-tRNA(Asn)/glutamyl-tRNA(Gln) amidotransferase subunit A